MMHGIIFIFISFSDCLLLVYRNTNGFCILTLYPVTFLSLLISSSSFFLIGQFHRIFNTNDHVVCEYRVLFLPFQFACLFITCLARISGSELKRTDKGAGNFNLGRQNLQVGNFPKYKKFT